MFTASFSAFKSSCILFLCCYRATLQTFYHPRRDCFQTGVSPGIPQKSIELPILFSSIVAPKITLKTIPKSPSSRVLIKIGIPLCFYSFPNGTHKPRKLQYYLRKTHISTNPPFAFWSSFWHQQVSQHMPQTTLKPLNKSFRKHIQNRHQI